MVTINNKIRELDDQYESDLRVIQSKRDSLEEDYQRFMQVTDDLKEQVYQATLKREMELSPEAKGHLYQMDINTDDFKSKFQKEIAELDEEQSQLKKEYDKQVEKIYEESRQDQDDNTDSAT
ncbi:Uncharacterised protein [Streptococcus criceti]|uniref:Uncharacterized protein n=1 Tax=Streptococcus criceti HS-6 TaxID=873449 RepID=G5JN62_STRCG|nr:hypothetical protein [Streptococcus criceti]EHI75534.1 hypothetical protein STRCR_1397 [Streptococcus criceti HS-6]SUN43360.1 Uncharacterised protein [Streptococcus criceti]